MLNISEIPRRVTAVLTCSLIVFSAFFGVIFIYGPILPLMFIWPKLYRRATEIIGSIWQSVLVAVNEKVYGIEMVFTGDGVKHHEKTVMLLNHRTRLDWFFFFSYVFHSSLLNRHKIALKAMLKWFPGIGWAMQADSYIFLDRNWDTDQEHIKKILTYQIDLQSKPNILFFPEGTDLTPNTKRRSNEFAKKNNLQQYEYVLQPRTKGFCFFVNTLREIGGINAVHDVTVGYPYNISQGEKELIRGQVPRAVHFHFQRYDIKDLPTEEDKLSSWIQERWQEKEERLREYYSEDDPSKRRFSSKPCINITPRSFLLWLSLVFWTFFIVFSTHIMIASPICRFYALVMVLFYLSCGLFFGGVDKVEMFFYEFFKPSHLWGKSSGGDSRAGGDAPGTNPYDRYLRR